ncbi:MAG: hypothetical protein HOM58_05570 [Rhodospirillaceae bacterium]|nr:hypothetical protein [Rhodospirillaceae bacterium]MBT5458934.1 hypothetical protein [Rhodospirillaceae bacterium]
MRRLIAFVALVSALPVPAQADMKVRLKDGRTISVPVDKDEVDAITFGKPDALRPLAKRAADRIREDSDQIRFAEEAARKAAEAAQRAEEAAGIAQRAAKTARQAQRDAEAALTAARKVAVQPPAAAPLPDPLGPPSQDIRPAPLTRPRAKVLPTPKIHPTQKVQKPKKSDATRRFSPSGARVLSVGQGQRFAVPSQAANYARDGDVIEIQAGDYRADVAVWRANNLVIRGIGGTVVLDAAGRSAEGKAIWVIKGRNTTIQNIAFTGSRVRDRNGAGIRQEGAGLVVRDCAFYGNEMGILTGKNDESDILIERSRFFGNVVDYTKHQRLGHNIYIGQVRSFTIRYSHVSGARYGHNIKSRAHNNVVIYNMVADGADGASSYLLDLPNGGKSLVMGNVFHQGAKTENWSMISFGAEKRDAGDDLHVVNNSFINDRGTGIFIQRRSPGKTEVYNNLFSGGGTVLTGNGHVESNLIVDKRKFGRLRKLLAHGPVRPATGDLKGNLIAADAGFVEPEKMDFRLRKDSPAIDIGMNVPATFGQSRTPSFQYRNNLKSEARPKRGKIDMGAFEFAGP